MVAKIGIVDDIKYCISMRHGINIYLNSIAHGKTMI